MKILETGSDILHVWEKLLIWTMAWWGLLLNLVWVQKNIITLQTLVNSLLAWALVNPIIYKVSPKIQYSKFVGQYFLFCLVDFENCEYASVINSHAIMLHIIRHWYSSRLQTTNALQLLSMETLRLWLLPRNPIIKVWYNQTSLSTRHFP